MTMDVTKAIEAKSDQLNADDLIGGPRTIRIRDVAVKGGAEQPVWIYFDGDDGKPWKPCKSATRVLASCWGVDAGNWIGKHCTIYNDPSVTWAGMAVGGVRVSHAEGIAKPLKLALTKTRGKKGIVTIEPLVVTDRKTEPMKTESPVIPTIDTKTLFQDARDNAELGREGFGKWWKSKTKPERDAMGEIMDELKEITQKADSGNN